MLVKTGSRRQISKVLQMIDRCHRIDVSIADRCHRIDVSIADRCHRIDVSITEALTS